MAELGIEDPPPPPRRSPIRVAARARVLFSRGPRPRMVEVGCLATRQSGRPSRRSLRKRRERRRSVGVLAWALRSHAEVLAGIQDVLRAVAVAARALEARHAAGLTHAAIGSAQRLHVGRTRRHRVALADEHARSAPGWLKRAFLGARRAGVAARAPQDGSASHAEAEREGPQTCVDVQGGQPTSDGDGPLWSPIRRGI
jgi:hypothetical protein